jgi:transposase
MAESMLPINKRNRLHRTADRHKLCADINGAYNILRKRRPGAFSEVKEVAAYVVPPVRLAVAV